MSITRCERDSIYSFALLDGALDGDLVPKFPIGDKHTSTSRPVFLQMNAHIYTTNLRVLVSRLILILTAWMLIYSQMTST